MGLLYLYLIQLLWKT
jgi:hypothetical protein